MLWKRARWLLQLLPMLLSDPLVYQWTSIFIWSSMRYFPRKETIVRDVTYNKHSIRTKRCRYQTAAANGKTEAVSMIWLQSRLGFCVCACADGRCFFLFIRIVWIFLDFYAFIIIFCFNEIFLHPFSLVNKSGQCCSCVRACVYACVNEKEN